MLKMDGEGGKSTVVWGGPAVGGEVEFAGVLLHTEVSVALSHTETKVLTCNNFATRARTFKKTFFMSRDTVVRDGNQ